MNKGNKYYIAYGFFINIAQMADKCPTAAAVGISELKGYRLRFKGADAEALSTVEPDKDSSVPVLVWEITPADETALDRCEGFPALCSKETVKVKLDSRTINALAYIPNSEELLLGRPGAYHYNTILEGYEVAGFDTDILKKALAESAATVPAPSEEPV